MGYAAKGIVYLVVGVLAGLAALGEGGRTTGSKGAIHEIGQQSFGQVLLLIVGIGLACYALWQFLAALFDAEGEGTDAKAIVARTGYAVSGIIHAGFAFAAIHPLFGGNSGSGGGDTESMTARLMALPLGPWLVILAGIAVGGVGIVQWRRAIKGEYRQRFDLDGRAAAQSDWIERISKMGLLARGVVLLLIAFFLVQAGWKADAGKARGFGGALDAIAQASYGPWLLGITAVGVICYGIYCAIVAIYGRFA